MVGLILAVAGKEHVYRDLFGTPRGNRCCRARSEGLRDQKEKKKTEWQVGVRSRGRYVEGINHLEVGKYSTGTG